jgi:RNA polymerase sigma-70 factor, ECF subfamily
VFRIFIELGGGFLAKVERHSPGMCEIERHACGDVNGRYQSMSATEFANLYAALLPQVRAFLRRAGCARRDLEDLTQETFLRAWNGRGEFLGASQFRTWLLGIARNAIRESWRKKQLIIELLDGDAPRETAGRQADPEMLNVMRRAIAQLPEKQRLAISLVYLNGLTQSDAATQSKCAGAAFRRRLSSGRTQLRRLLERAGK